MKKRLVAFLLVLIMVLGMLPVSAFAADDGVSPQALESNETQTIKYQILYVGDEFNIGYNYGVSVNKTYTCQYSTGHSGFNHSILISEFRNVGVPALKGQLDSGYEFVGWAKEAKKNPTIFDFNTAGTTATQTTYTIYLVAKKAVPPTVTYTLTYYPNTTDLVTNMPSPNPVTQKSSTSPVTFTVSSAIPAREGYNFLGWNGKPDATTPTVQPGNWVTTPATATRLYAVWQSNTPPTDKPAKPTENDVTGVVVDIVCVTTTGTHDTVQYPLGHPTDAQHTIGEVVSDGAGGYICPVTVRTAWFVQQASNLRWKVQHTPTAQTITFNLTYDKNSKTWVKPAANPRIEATHEVTPPTKPTALDGSFAIVCKNNKATHPYKADYIATPSQYTISDVQKDEQGYYVTATVTVAPNLVAYNKATRVEHRLVDEQDATLTITFRYDTEVTVDGNRKWQQQGDLPVVEVICKPKAPTADELKKLEMAVQVKCVVDASQQHTAAYGLLGEYDEDYFVFEPRQEGDDWLCDINYYPERYVAEFNTTFQNLKHVQNDEKIVPVTLIWDGGSWQLKTQGRVHVTEEYTVTFNAYGGFPTPDEQHVKSGEKAVLPVEPTLKGYTFAFWYLGEDEQNATAYDFNTPVTENITLTAKWNISKYTVTFNPYGGTPVPPAQEVEYGLTATKPADPTLKGYTFAFWYLGEDEQNATAYDFDTPVTENITLTAKWNINKYTVTFNTDGGTPVPPAQEVEYGLTATEPAAPEKTGYTFDGWYLGEAEEPFSFDTAITSDITLTAKWHVTPHNIYAYARLNSYFAPLTTNEFDTPVTLNEATLSRLGLGSYNSLGYISIGSFTFDAMPLTDDQYFGNDAELSAVAEKLATDIALETGVSDKIAEKIAWTVLYKTVNEEDMAPGYPAEAGYQLSGNLDLATVMFKANGENVTGMPEDNYVYNDVVGLYDFYFAGDTFTMPADPTREGYIFEGWSVKVLPAENDADHLDADGADDAADETLLKAGDTYTITAGGVVFTAQWEARTDTPYTVEHYLENLDGSYALDTTEPLKGTTDTTVTAAAKSYDNFTYDSTVPGTVASGNIAGDGSLVLKLFYTRNTYDYTVRHIKQLPDGTYDEANAEVETLSGKFEALAAVTAKDYGEHYPTNDADTKQNIKIEEGLTIDVKYDLDEHTLTFETNGGSAIDPVTVRHGNAVARPADPTKDKYTFIGWYVDPEFSAEYDFATVLEADKTIYAKFELTSTPIGDIYVRYDVLHIKQLPDGSYDLANAEVEHLSAKKDTTVTAVVKDYRATHHINVNSTLSKLTDTAIQPYPGADGKPVYTILSVYYDLDFHTLTFDTMGGSRIDPVTVRHGNAVAKPKDPVNGGYIFDGWYTDKTYRTPYNFATVLTQDTTIYAKWFLIALPGVTIKKTTPKLNTSDHFAYVQGYPDGTVKPAGNITRAETAAILFRLMDDASRKTYYSTKSGFRDVASGSWYNTYVATLNNAGVITDSSNGYFRPNEAITRAELAAMLAKFSETTGAANYFNDVSAKYWAANAIAICAKLGWITGYPDGTFRPDKNVTRAELMAMINRATGRAPKSADAFLPGMKTWSDNTADKWYYLDVQEATNSHSYTVKGSETWTALTSDPNWSLYE